ncbi:MAG: AAA-like domain-containing protein, partial [Cyanobacteria bacterium J06621_15]
MTANNSNFYQVGASLPVNAPSYVQRQADEEFYQKLQAGKFCYVLNSRQMGKSSLRVQTMQRLQKQETVCAAIDLTGIGKVTKEQWYGGIVFNLSESFQLEDKFDFDWQEWWEKQLENLSPVQCLSLFIEKILLVKIQQSIVIFVDEIDKVLSQDFSLDDFFALIRFFRNQRVDNPIFERLTFALLGVATPGDLITDKTQTPFNIGEAIELHGFKIDEVEPLIKGLQGRFDTPQKVMAEILDWTGGQPFLTQKLCKFMVEESEKDNPRSVEEVVIKRIIENWESQDNPEHLRTIRDRIISSEQRAGYLLELYQ